ncbi:MAG: hypothetical protein LBT97_11065 [Planctomycetota bacterium]|nr:hypothetical protein [Planctomycetota bacterium]
MDNDAIPVLQEDSGSRKINVWTPEDAARFLSSAIQEAQRPLTDALRQRSVSPGLFALVIALLVAAAAVCGWILFDRLEKSDQAADGARMDREYAVGQRYDLQARHDALASRYTAAQEIADRSRRELGSEIERLRTEIAGLKANEDELRRLRADHQKYRRRDEQLRNQIAGLELENQALARQLSAVKALSLSERDPALDEFPGDGEVDAAGFTGPSIAPDLGATGNPADSTAPAESAAAPSPVPPAENSESPAGGVESPATTPDGADEKVDATPWAESPRAADDRSGGDKPLDANAGDS